jgi:hypothetical protein
MNKVWWPYLRLAFLSGRLPCFGASTGDSRKVSETMWPSTHMVEYSLVPSSLSRLIKDKRLRAVIK